MPGSWAGPLQADLIKHRRKSVRMHCGRRRCGIVLDTLVVSWLNDGETGETIYHFVGGGRFSTFGDRTSRPHIEHGPISDVIVDGNLVMAWECKCGAVYKLGRRRLAELFLTAVSNGHRDVTISA